MDYIIKDSCSIICGGFNQCKSKDYYPCIDCWHKVWI